MMLDGKVAIITGSASGIGRTAAYLFAQEGARVVVADINKEQGEEVVKNIKTEGNEATFIPVNVSVVSDLDKLIRMTAQKYGQLHIFWSNAGIAGPGSIDRTTEEDYDRTMAVNLKASVFGAKSAIPQIRDSGGGSILFTSSIAGLRPGFSLPYSLSKAGLIMLTKSLAISLAKDNIRVNCICPGPVHTPLLHYIMTRDRDITPPEIIDKAFRERIPAGRYIKEEEIAQAALFLVSEHASAITGVDLPVDCGYLAV